MKTTKLGISVGFMGAILCGLGLFCGYFITIAAVAYVLVCEENMWLRKTSVKVLVLTLAFPFLHMLIDFVPNIVSFINNVMNLFDDYFRFEKLSEIVTVLKDIVNISKYIVFILLGILAFSQRTFRIFILDSIIDKHIKPKTNHRGEE